jgi:hypothetical protein
MGTRWARFARGLLAALASTSVAALSHAMAGGGAPSTLSLVIAVSFSALVCVALTGRRLSAARMSAAVALSQFAFHGVFAGLGGASGHAAAALEGAGHGAHSATSIALAAVPTAQHHTSGWMWLAHALAALATIVVLRRGEAAFWGMRDAALRFLATVFAVAPVLPFTPPAAPVVARVAAPRHFEFLLGSLQHRGPPALSY